MKEITILFKDGHRETDLVFGDVNSGMTGLTYQGGIDGARKEVVLTDTVIRWSEREINDIDDYRKKRGEFNRPIVCGMFETSSQAELMGRLDIIHQQLYEDIKLLSSRLKKLEDK